MLDKLGQFFYGDKFKANFKQGYNLGIQSGKSMARRELLETLESHQIETGLRTEYSNGYQRAIKILKGWD